MRFFNIKIGIIVKPPVHLEAQYLSRPDKYKALDNIKPDTKTKAVAKPVVAKPVAEPVVNDGVDLSKLTFNELKAKAKAEGLTFNNKITKVGLIELLSR